MSLAPPAAADCAPDLGTGTYACAFADAPSYASVDEWQAGVGGAHADAYEHSFFGQTYRGRSAMAYTEPSGPAGSNMVSAYGFCMAGSDGTCRVQDERVGVYTSEGCWHATLSQGGGSRILCSGIAGTNECQPF